MPMDNMTPAQKRLFRAVAHGWHPDRVKGPTQAVAKEMVNADKAKKARKRAAAKK
ncbi:MAG TPA: hypothetical protein VET26_00770 [Candidatus Sulfotelmatobacter sp.]|nr:hypothetical protein [Candidatus Sulfotelmatobacter sp.]